MTVLLLLVHITKEGNLFMLQVPIIIPSALLIVPAPLEMNSIIMHFDHLTLNTHSYKVIAHIHFNTEPKEYYFKHIYR